MSRNLVVRLLIAGAIVASLVLWISRPGRRAEPPEPLATAAAPQSRPPATPVTLESPSTEAEAASASAPKQPAFSGNSPQSLPTQSPFRVPSQLVPSREITAELDEVRTTLRDYRTAVGENPVGTNAEITSALLGQNSRQLRLGVPPGSTLSGAGELCDPWGTPYFFHQLSRTDMEIRSAGPDRTMWTDDDRLTR